MLAENYVTLYPPISGPRIRVQCAVLTRVVAGAGWGGGATSHDGTPVRRESGHPPPPCASHPDLRTPVIHFWRKQIGSIGVRGLSGVG